MRATILLTGRHLSMSQSAKSSFLFLGNEVVSPQPVDDELLPLDPSIEVSHVICREHRSVK